MSKVKIDQKDVGYIVISEEANDILNAVKERKFYFKKVPNETESTFKVENSSDFFEKTNSNIERYIGRQNGASLTLMEFVSYYEFIGKEESRQLLKLFSSQNSLFPMLFWVLHE